jgi:hypothetical protein
MPIGKNALKRVENNGYSKVKSAAPDMENSEVAVKAEETVQPAPAPKKTPAKKTAVKKPTEKKAVGKQVEPAISLGGELPYYLL